MNKEKIEKKAGEIMNQGDWLKSDLLSDYEVTKHIALETAQWVEKTIIEKSCRWLEQQGMKPHVVVAFKKAMEAEA